MPVRAPKCLRIKGLRGGCALELIDPSKMGKETLVVVARPMPFARLPCSCWRHKTPLICQGRDCSHPTSVGCAFTDHSST